MLIRDATESDWPAIWPFLHDIVAAGETYTLDPGLDEQQARAMWMVPPPGRTFVAELEDSDSSASGSSRGSGGSVLAGTAKLVTNHQGPGSHIAGASFMVNPASGQRGVGRALGEHVLKAARAAGYRAMQFNAVVESNTRAVALWRSLGFEIIGTLPEGFHHPVHGYVGLHIMHRTL